MSLEVWCPMSPQRRRGCVQLLTALLYLASGSTCGANNQRQAVNASRIAVVLYGGVYDACNLQTASDLSRAFVKPMLAAGHSVHVHVAATGTRSHWEQWLTGVHGLEPSSWSISAVGPVPPFSESHYAHDCNPWHVSEEHAHYHEHSNHMEQAWKAAMAYETERNFLYDFVLKTRCDLQIHPRQTFEACYLEAVTDKMLLSPDIEFFCHNRWNERGHGLGEGAWECSAAGMNPPLASPTFPEWMPDLLFFGRREPMSVALTIDSSPMLMPCWPRDSYVAAPGMNRTMLVERLGNNERLMAEHVFSHGIYVHAVPLQLGRYIFGNGKSECEGAGCWNRVPCKLCLVCSE